MKLLRFLPMGKLPDEAFDLLRPEAVERVHERVSASITLIGFRSRRRICAWKRQWFVGSLALASDRLVAFRWNSRLINLRFDDPRCRKVSFAVLRNGRLQIKHDAGLFHSDWSGLIEYRFSVPDATRIVAEIKEHVEVGYCNRMAIE